MSIKEGKYILLKEYLNIKEYLIFVCWNKVYKIEMMSRICLEYTEFYLVAIKFSKPFIRFAAIDLAVRENKIFLQPWLINIVDILIWKFT